MTSWILVALGGGLGSLARFACSSFILSRERKYLPGGVDFPYATIAINVTGSFLMGLLFAAGWEGNLYALFAEGFLGAFTTFSTYLYEGLSLLHSRKLGMGIVYLTSSALLGVACFFCGVALVL